MAPMLPPRALLATEDASRCGSDNDVDEENEEEGGESGEELEKALLARALRVESAPSEGDPLTPRLPATPKSVEESLEDYPHDQALEPACLSQARLQLRAREVAPSWAQLPWATGVFCELGACQFVGCELILLPLSPQDSQASHRDSRVLRKLACPSSLAARRARRAAARR